MRSLHLDLYADLVCPWCWIGDRRLFRAIDAIRATGCEAMVSADCGCLLSLNLMLKKRRDLMRGQHIASLIRERLDGGEAR